MEWCAFVHPLFELPLRLPGMKISNFSLSIIKRKVVMTSEVRLDIPEDQGKGKVGSRKVLHFQDTNYLLLTSDAPEPSFLVSKLS